VVASGTVVASRAAPAHSAAASSTIAVGADVVVKHSRDREHGVGEGPRGVRREHRLGADDVGA
jgi:hypothetical protein